MMQKMLIASLAICALFQSCLPTSNAAVILGPTPYLAFDGSVSGAGTAVSPFSSLNFDYFHLQDFENTAGVIRTDDPLYTTPGVTLSPAFGATVLGQTVFIGSGVGGSTVVDSVDADDGSIDGSGLTGRSFLNLTGGIGFQFNFSSTDLGKLPTHAGLVWTDGARTGLIRFEAFDANNQSLGFLEVGGFQDNVVNGTTAEDRFFGVIHDGGISAIAIRTLTGAGGLEVDHLQYGYIAPTQAVPEPSSLACMAVLGLTATQLRRRKSPTCH